MPKQSKPWPKTTREEVLLRCCFRCSRPGCSDRAEDWRLATDLHHAKFRSQGGSDLPGNLLGLCASYHRWVHAKHQQFFDPDIGRVVSRVELAQHWLAEQLQARPVRIDSITRNALFGEVQAATSSTEAMEHHDAAVYVSHSWSNYEVFLKASWAFLEEQRKTRSTQGCVVLMRMVDLYRRRSGKQHQLAARQTVTALRAHLDDLDRTEVHRWLIGLARYHEAYLHFLTDAQSENAQRLFDESAQAQKVGGTAVGELISQAQGLVLLMRRGVDVTDWLKRLVDKLGRHTDSAALRWRNENLPTHVAMNLLHKRQFAKAAVLLKQPLGPKRVTDPAADFRPAKALYLYGVARLMVADLQTRALRHSPGREGTTTQMRQLKGVERFSLRSAMRTGGSGIDGLHSIPTRRPPASPRTWTTRHPSLPHGNVSHSFLAVALGHLAWCSCRSSR